ncbi:Cobyrinic acid A,C-diamide synthase [Corynebacterium ciconiae DSM 44920]|uniref:cobyrinate a,c-diamide synthase n=1 Tax=Corynebacterium ciconiae TaxID=227319 RepID=UPI00036DF204|nr:cobyrinate a,c-diamide synthase [Corynebacterium ciconiae]WKD61453.1 Cobyrinic acid A,C-diamide synthase [Corynebacterium ciconiae DSM 44920]
MVSVPGVCIAATASGTGKTTIATGLMGALARRMRVAPFKVGPDYIDPGYHGLAAQRVGRNLDSVMCSRERIGPLYAHGSAGCDIAVMEGVMGLFDGRITDSPDDAGAGSTAEIAALLGMPVILVVDVRGMSQSAGAIVRGFATHHPEVRIAGAIINKAGTDRHAEVCRRAIENTGVPVVGIIPRIDKVEVPSRHLGLVTAAEQGGAAVDAVARMADMIESYVDIDAVLDLATCHYDGPAWDPTAEVEPVAAAPRIALASGPVFSFAYAEHTELLGAAGAQVVEFDPLHEELPECEGLIIPGGFPEEHVEELAARRSVTAAVQEHIAAGKPVHAECAGLLWLLKTLDAHPMVGAIGTHGAMGRRLKLGYREAVALEPSVLYDAGQRVTGHEFHHTALAEETATGFQPAWGWRGWDGAAVAEGFISDTIHASYLHVHPASVPQSIAHFVRAAAAHR